jgi:hypothetical protein
MSNLNETTKEELEVIQSMWPNEVKELDGWFEINITHHVDLAPLILQFQFSKSYPETIPNIYINANWLDGSEISEITTKLQSMFQCEQILFQWIQYLKEELMDLALSKVREMNQPVIKQIPNQILPDITILSTPSFTTKKSKFIGHISAVNSMEDVRDMLIRLESDNKITKATHNMFAYRFLENRIVNERNDDDGEQGASQLILFLMQKHQVLNFMVVVSRWYGGINLGPDRFKIIQNIAKQAMELRNKF